MLGEMELKVKINIEELDKIINKRDCRKNTYMIMNKENPPVMGTGGFLYRYLKEWE